LGGKYKWKSNKSNHNILAELKICINQDFIPWEEMDVSLTVMDFRNY
jgi:hypothetical protein